MNDFQLSPHFGFFEITKTNNLKLLEQNRVQAKIYMPTLLVLTNDLLEPVRGDRPLATNSGFRGDALNAVTPGSSRTSQHPLGQAWDGYRPGQAVQETFEEMVKRLEMLGIPFGQIIFEVEERDYGIQEWIHLSLGPGYRTLSKCGQVLKKRHGRYTLLKQLDVRY